MAESNIEQTPLVASERAALRRYADGLEDWAIAVLIGSAVWNVEHLEAALGAIYAETAIVGDEPSGDAEYGDLERVVLAIRALATPRLVDGCAEDQDG